MKNKFLYGLAFVFGISMLFFVNSKFLLRVEQTEIKKVNEEKNIQFSKITSIKNESIEIVQKKPVEVESVEEYFKRTMTDDEVGILLEKLDRKDKGFPTDEVKFTSRDFDQEEDKRFLILDDSFRYDGNRPQNKALLIENETGFYFDDTNLVFVLPERTLTDEELLEIVEYQHKVNHVYFTKNSFYEEISEKANPENIIVDEQESIKIARDTIKKLYNENVEDVFSTASIFKDEHGNFEKNWFIRIEPEKRNTLLANGESFYGYMVLVDYTTGDLLDITRSFSSPSDLNFDDAQKEEYVKDKLSESELDLLLNDKKLQDLALNSASSIIKSKGTASFSKAVVEDDLVFPFYDFATNYYGKDALRKRGVVVFQIDFSEGSSYFVTINVKNLEIKSIAKYDEKEKY